MIDYIIIGMVLHEPLTGYDIKKRIESGIGYFVKASHGSLYPALKKLADKDFLTMNEEPQGERMRKCYQATEIGKAAFLEWLSSPIDSSSITVNLLSKIYFFDELTEDIRHEQLQEYEAHIQQILREYKKLQKQHSDENSENGSYYEWATLYYGLQSAQGMIRWLRCVKEQKSLSELVREDE
jgi:DNA-binding PadR family transcriptional regulator